MAYQQRENSGTLFRNEKREKDSQPNARGTALIDGVEYEVSAWTKHGQKGAFQSLSFKRKGDARPTQDDRNSYGDRHQEGEIPF